MKTISLAMFFLLAGCITTHEGNAPQPASQEQRLQAQLDLARGYLEKGDWVRARPPLSKALEIDSRSVEAYVLMAVLSEQEGEPDIAESYYKRALRVAPNDAQALNNYGRLLYGLGRYDDCLVPLRKVVAMPDYPRRAQAYENLGLAELKVGQLDAAAQSFKRSVRLNNRQARSMLELATLEFDEGNFDVSNRHYQEFVNIARQTPRSLWLCIRLGREHSDQNMLASCSLALTNLYSQSPEYQQYRESIQ